MGHENFIQKQSPFSNLKNISNDAVTSTTRVAKLGQYIPKTGLAAKPVVSYPYIAYRQADVAIPPYTTYISTKRNILIEDDKHRTFMPYLGEAFDVDIADGEYAALESKIEDNQRNYREMNKKMEKASLYASIIEDFLNEVGSSSMAVLQYLLDDSEPPPPTELPLDLQSYWQKRIDYLRDEGYFENPDDSDVTTRRRSSPIKKPQKQWRQLYLNLPEPTSGREVAAACLACHVFSRVTGLSLFHVVKQLQLERDQLLEKAKSEEDTISVREDYTVPDIHSLGTYTELVCQICKA